jgi:flagellin
VNGGAACAAQLTEGIKTMSSLLTNESAMVALRTLQTITKNLGTAQNAISTGKTIATAEDNPAIWAIAATMKSDMTGFRALVGNLALGRATLGVGRDGAEQVVEVIDQLKSRVIAGHEENVDREKVQKDVEQLIAQVKSIVDSAQFNGVSMLKSTEAMTVTASLARQSDQTVIADRIDYRLHDLTFSKGEVGAEPMTEPSPAITADPAPPTTLAMGDTATVSLKTHAPAKGESYTVELGGVAYSYVASGEDDLNAIATGLRNLILLDQPANADIEIAIARAVDPTETDVKLIVVNNGDDKTFDIDSAAGGEPTGGFAGLDDFDVTNREGAQAALDALEGFMQRAIAAAAEYGSAQGAVNTAEGFVSLMIDSFASGVGAMVDSDMEEASARLAALQVQQQLGVQALSIANQAPQNILALFQN